MFKCYCGTKCKKLGNCNYKSASKKYQQNDYTDKKVRQFYLEYPIYPIYNNKPRNSNSVQNCET